MAVNMVIMPLKANARIKAGPAMPAAIPVSTKIPAPIIPPMPIIVMVNKFKFLLSVTPVEKLDSGLLFEPIIRIPFTSVLINEFYPTNSKKTH
jgi:hypothetical protein